MQSVQIYPWVWKHNSSIRMKASIEVIFELDKFQQKIYRHLKFHSDFRQFNQFFNNRKKTLLKSKETHLRLYVKLKISIVQICKKMASTSICSFHTIFGFTVNVTDLASQPIESPEVKLSNINWKVKLKKKSNDRKNKLGIFLVSNFDDNTVKWSCGAQATFKLLPNDNDELKQSIVKYLPKQKFSNEKRSHGYGKFVQWKKFLKHFVNKKTKPALKLRFQQSHWCVRSDRVSIKNMRNFGLPLKMWASLVIFFGFSVCRKWRLVCRLAV